MIPIIEVAGVQASLLEEAHSIVKELLWGVRVFSKDLDFLTIFDTTEQDFGGILRGIYTPK